MYQHRHTLIFHSTGSVTCSSVKMIQLGLSSNQILLGSYSWTTWMKPARLGSDFNRKNSTMQSLGWTWASPTLVELHCTDVCVYVRTCLRPHTVNYKSMLKCFLKIQRPHALAWQCWATASRSGESSNLSMHGTLLLVCHSSYAPIFNGRLLADCTNLYTLS